MTRSMTTVANWEKSTFSQSYSQSRCLRIIGFGAISVKTIFYKDRSIVSDNWIFWLKILDLSGKKPKIKRFLCSVLPRGLKHAEAPPKQLGIIFS